MKLYTDPPSAPPPPAEKLLGATEIKEDSIFLFNEFLVT